MGAAWNFPQVFDLPRPGDTKTIIENGQRIFYQIGNRFLKGRPGHR
jgi:hypothetical protein